MSSDKEKEAAGEKNEEKVSLKHAEDGMADGYLPAEDGVGNNSELDSSRAHFIKKDGAGDPAAEAHVDIEGKTHVGPESEFAGLTKDELMKYADDPYWKKVRLVLLILFWVAWFGMLVAAIVIIIVAPKCPPKPDLDWWQTGLAYKVYPRSFKDHDVAESSVADGVGDLQGIKEKLGYLRDNLTVRVLHINPIYPSMDRDFGYDVTDYKGIHPALGTMDDFDNLLAAMHKKDMKLILDFVPNHSSDNHTWFQKSILREDPYTDYYVWQAGGGPSNAPNEWVNENGESAWTYNDDRQMWYYHRFTSDKPDLNLRNDAVKKELAEALQFWLDKGVDGIQINAAAYLYEDESLKNDPNLPLDTFTAYQPESYELVAEWRALLDQASEKNSKSRLLVVEQSGNGNQTAQFRRYNDKEGAHMSTNAALLQLTSGCRAMCINNLTTSVMAANGDADVWNNWMIGNQDTSRLATRMGGETAVNAVNMLLLTLPGTAFTYYGEEIGMHDVDVPFTETQDPAALDKGPSNYKQFSRDPERTPMQWTPGKNAGFTTGTPWLPVAADYKTYNVKTEQAHGAGVTMLEVYSSIAALRQNASFQWGDFNPSVIEDVFFYVRQAEGFPGYLVAINFGVEGATVDFLAGDKNHLIPKQATVVGNTANFGTPSRTEDYRVGTEGVRLNNIHLGSFEGVIFEWPAGEAGKNEL